MSFQWPSQWKPDRNIVVETGYLGLNYIIEIIERSLSHYRYVLDVVCPRKISTKTVIVRKPLFFNSWTLVKTVEQKTIETSVEKTRVFKNFWNECFKKLLKRLFWKRLVTSLVSFNLSQLKNTQQYLRVWQVGNFFFGLVISCKNTQLFFLLT